jgi:hypothetical protein
MVSAGRIQQYLFDAACALEIQDLIKEYFRPSIDVMAREHALFEGPPPLLLASMNVDDLCILLSGSDKKNVTGWGTN